MKKISISLVLLALSLTSFAQNQLHGNWVIKKVEIPHVVIAENDSSKVNPEFLKTIEEENRPFMEGLMKGMVSAMLNSEMEFKLNDELIQFNAASKKKFKGKYKYNVAKNELKTSDASGNQKFLISFNDANIIILEKEDAKLGSMIFTLHRK